MSELSEKLKSLGCLFEFTHLFIDSCKDEESIILDHWKVNIYYNGNNYSTEYITEIGLRKLSNPIVKEGLNKYYNKITNEIKNQFDAAKANWLKVVTPEDADVMYSLLMDAGCSIESFDDFCENLGYSNDSIKALNIYLKCQKTKASLVKLLGYKNFEELSKLEH